MSSGDQQAQVCTRRMKNAANGGENIFDEFDQLKNVTDDQPEVKDLLEDQIFHTFVEKTVFPDHGPINEEDPVDMDDFVPEDDAIAEAEDGGSSEDDLDNECLAEDEVVKICGDASGNASEMFKDVPPGMVAAYKKRFPNFWRMHQGLRNHSGLGYDQEEDPDFEVIVDESDSSDASSDGENDDMEKEVGGLSGDLEKEIGDLACMVEDMAVIPDDSNSVVELLPSVQDEEGLDDSQGSVEAMASLKLVAYDITDEEEDGEYQPEDDSDDSDDSDEITSSDDSASAVEEEDETEDNMEN